MHLGISSCPFAASASAQAQRHQRVADQLARIRALVDQGDIPEDLGVWVLEQLSDSEAVREERDQLIAHHAKRLGGDKLYRGCQRLTEYLLADHPSVRDLSALNCDMPQLDQMYAIASRQSSEPYLTPQWAVEKAARIAEALRAKGFEVPPSLIVPTEVAAVVLNKSPRTLEGWRQRGSGPRYTNDMGRPMYDIEQLVVWQYRYQLRKATHDKSTAVS